MAMTDAEKIAFVQTLVENDAAATENTVGVYLSLALGKIRDEMYPFDTSGEKTVPERYDQLQCELASRLFLRRGAQGEVAHNENGVNRTYGSVDDRDLLNKIIPFAKLPGARLDTETESEGEDAQP